MLDNWFAGMGIGVMIGAIYAASPPLRTAPKLRVVTVVAVAFIISNLASHYVRYLI